MGSQAVFRQINSSSRGKTTEGTQDVMTAAVDHIEMCCGGSPPDL